MWHVFTTAWQVSRTACLKAGGGSFGQLERCSSECQSVAQIDHRDASAMKGKRPACTVNAVSCVACLKPWSARGLVKRVSKPGSDRRKEVSSEPSMFQGAGLCNELCSFGPLHEPSVRPILVPAYSHYEAQDYKLSIMSI